MDIAAIAMSLNQAKVQEAVSLSVLKMALGNNDSSANRITQIMQQPSNHEMARSVQPHLGASIDLRA